MAAKSQRQGRIPSASSLKRSGADDTQLQLLSPEGSTLYMTEVKVHEMPTDSSWQVERGDDYRHGNPITSKGTTLLGAPYKTNTVGSPSHNQLHTTGLGLDAVTNQLSELSVADERGSTGAAEESESSNSESSSDSESAVLERAKVEGIDLERLEAGPDGKAPLELVSQFVFCLMRDEYKAAKILCEKVMQLEPQNETAEQFYPLIQERIQLDDTLSTESSSSDDTEVSDDSSDHTHSSSASSESSSDSEGESAQLVPVANDSTAATGAGAGGREKGQGSQMKNSHKQCSQSAASWQP